MRSNAEETKLIAYDKFSKNFEYFHPKYVQRVKSSFRLISVLRTINACAPFLFVHNAVL